MIASRNDITETNKAWMVQLDANNHKIDFKIDTGASVTAVPKQLISIVSKLEKTNKILRGAGNHKLNVIGKAEVKLGFRGPKMTEVVYVVDGLITPLLGKPAISKLGILNCMGEVLEDNRSHWTNKFPRLLKGLGT